MAPPTIKPVDFYAKFDAGVLDWTHPLVKDLRPHNVSDVRALMTAVAAERGRDYAKTVVKKFYAESFKRQPLDSWEILPNYLNLAQALEKSDSPLLKKIGDFVETKIHAFLMKNRGNCEEAFRALCNGVDQKGELAAKIAHHYHTGGLARVAGKFLTKAEDFFGDRGAEGIQEKYRSGELRRHRVKGTLPGFSVEEIRINGDTAAVFIAGDPKKGARARMKIAVGGGATVESLEKEYGRSLQFQGPVGFQHGAKLPQELTIYNGKPVREIPPDATRHDGYVLTFPDGRFTIVDKRTILLSEITGKQGDAWVLLRLRGDGDITDVGRFKEAMRETQASSNATMLVATGGRPEWTRNNGDDERRLLATFADGTFGMISTIAGKERMGINDLLTLLIRVSEGRGGLVRAVYTDTGHYDFASYYTYDGESRKETVIGHPDQKTQFARIAFYQAEPEGEKK